MDRLLNVVAILSGALIVLVLTSLRRAHIRVEYSVSWLGAAVTLLALSQFRPLLEWLAGVLGVGDPPMAILFVAFSVFLLVFYRFSIMISELKDANIALSQRVAILQYQIESNNGETQTPVNR